VPQRKRIAVRAIRMNAICSVSDENNVVVILLSRKSDPKKTATDITTLADL
jgi:hypothetical protein